MSRFHNRTPIADRINLFGGAVKSPLRPSPSTSPCNPPSPPADNTKRSSTETPNPLVKTPSKSQFSAKDPSNGRNTSPTKKSNTGNTVPITKSEPGSKIFSNGNLNKINPSSPSIHKRLSQAVTKKVVARSSHTVTNVNPKSSQNYNKSHSSSPSKQGIHSKTSPVKTSNLNPSNVNKPEENENNEASLPDGTLVKTNNFSAAQSIVKFPENLSNAVKICPDQSDSTNPCKTLSDPIKSTNDLINTIIHSSNVSNNTNSSDPSNSVKPRQNSCKTIKPLSKNSNSGKTVLDQAKQDSLLQEVTLMVDTVDRANISNVNKVMGEPEQILVNNAINVSKDVKKSIVNNNINELVSGTTPTKQYWSTQALSNANSTSINQAMKLDAEFKEDKITALQRELQELQDGGSSEDEVRQLKKQKHDLEIHLKDQEEELDDLAGQVQLLESSKTKLEMQMAQLKKEQRRELQSKEDELEDARAVANKKVKILEQQLEQEHEERIGFLRERHELEGKIMTLQDMLERAGDEEQLGKLRKDLKRTKVLLRDAQIMIEKSQNEGSNKVVLRQLKNQLEDAEFTRTAAMKARQNAELELTDVQQQLDDVMRAKNDLEDKHLKLGREKAELGGQLQENEEDLLEVMKKYKASVAAVSTDQITIQDQAGTIAELENERNKLREQLAELATKVESLEGENVTTTQYKRLELKVRELESKLELEQTTRSRLETQISRLKEALEKMSQEADQLRVKEQSSQEGQRKIARQLRDLKEDFINLQTKETEITQKKTDLEKQLEVSEAETVTARNDLKLALKRIEDLQIAIAGEIDTDETNSEDNSESSDEEMSAFLEHHRRAMSVQKERESMARETALRESVTREIRASVAREFSVTRFHPTPKEEPESPPNGAHRQSFQVEDITEGDESQA